MTRREIETEWSINDVWDANIVLDLNEIAEDKAWSDANAGREK